MGLAAPAPMLTKAGRRGDSVYEQGRRSSAWTKEVLRRTTEAVICRLPAAGTGANAATIGSLMLATHDRDGALRYIGSVGTGFTTADRRHLHAELSRIRRDTPPLDVPASVARAAWWVEGQIVIDVEHR